MSLLDDNLAIFDASSVCGEFHLKQSAILANQAHECGYNISRTRSSEVLLYLSAQRQVTKSIEYAGITKETTAIAWISFGAPSKKLKTLVDEDASVIAESNFNYENFGISKEIINNLSRVELEKLVTTKCANLPVKRKK